MNNIPNIRAFHFRRYERVEKKKKKVDRPTLTKRAKMMLTKKSILTKKLIPILTLEGVEEKVIKFTLTPRKILLLEA